MHSSQGAVRQGCDIRFLIGAGASLGALVAGAPEGVCRLYRHYGAALGRAFQLQDDILGIWGDEAATGKSAASDILSKKKTLPVIYALAHEAVGAELAARYAGADFTEADVPVVLALLDAAGARPYVEALVRAATAEAHDALAAAAPSAVSEPHRHLGELLDALVVRSG